MCQLETLSRYLESIIDNRNQFQLSQSDIVRTSIQSEERLGEIFFVRAEGSMFRTIKIKINKEVVI